MSVVEELKLAAARMAPAVDEGGAPRPERKVPKTLAALGLFKTTGGDGGAGHGQG